jgi:hypothetical protein
MMLQNVKIKSGDEGEGMQQDMVCVPLRNYYSASLSFVRVTKGRKPRRFTRKNVRFNKPLLHSGEFYVQFKLQIRQVSKIAPQ